MSLAFSTTIYPISVQISIVCNSLINAVSFSFTMTILESSRCHGPGERTPRAQLSYHLMTGGFKDWKLIQFRLGPLGLRTKPYNDLMSPVPYTRYCIPKFYRKPSKNANSVSWI